MQHTKRTENTGSKDQENVESEATKQQTTDDGIDREPASGTAP